MNAFQMFTHRRISLRGGIFSKIPLWLCCFILLLVFGYWKSISDESLRVIFFSVSRGLIITFFVTGVGFTLSTLLGLVLGVMRTSKIYLLSQISRLYIELIRGLPVIVVLYYIAFVMSPFLLSFMNFLLTPLISLNLMEEISIRSFNFLWRGIIALVFAYSAFIAEIFRAGIESIDYGQIEAAKSLGFSRVKMFIPIILPQAIRNVLPALANELIAIVKDSALVSILGVADITQIGKVYSTSTFKYFESYNIIALLYLSLTLILSIIVKIVEKKFQSRTLNYTSAHP